MELNGFVGVIYKIGDWILKLLYVNILWILFIIVGGVILGVMPSTVALFTLMRKWMKNDEPPIFKTYWESYKKEFGKSNLIGLILGLATLILYIDYQVIINVPGTIFQLLAIVFIVLLIFFSLICLYIFPVFVNYELKWYQYFQFSFLIAFASPLSTIIMIFSLFVTAVLMMMVPGLIIFFSGSATAFIIMSAANRAFTKVKIKTESQTKDNITLS